MTRISSLFASATLAATLTLGATQLPATAAIDASSSPAIVQMDHGQAAQTTEQDTQMLAANTVTTRSLSGITMNSYRNVRVTYGAFDDSHSTDCYYGGRIHPCDPVKYGRILSYNSATGGRVALFHTYPAEKLLVTYSYELYCYEDGSGCMQFHFGGNIYYRISYYGLAMELWSVNAILYKYA